MVIYYIFQKEKRKALGKLQMFESICLTRFKHYVM
jgi:hypothetical protein